MLSVGAVEQHGPHLPVITDSLVGPEILGAALARLPDDVIVLGLPPTVYGKSVEHEEWPGTITYSGDTLRAVMMDIAKSVARSGFSKLVLLGSHGGNNGIIDDYFRDLRMATGLRVFKIHLGSIGNVPGLTTPEEAAVSMHGGDSETSAVRHLAPELVDMSAAEGYVYPLHPDVGYSFKGKDAIEAWVSADLSKSGAIGNPHPSDPAEGEDRGRGEGRPAGAAAGGDLSPAAARDLRGAERGGGRRLVVDRRLLSAAVRLPFVILKGSSATLSRTWRP